MDAIVELLHNQLLLLAPTLPGEDLKPDYVIKKNKEFDPEDVVREKSGPLSNGKQLDDRDILIGAHVALANDLPVCPQNAVQRLGDEVIVKQCEWGLPVSELLLLLVSGLLLLPLLELLQQALQVSELCWVCLRTSCTDTIVITFPGARTSLGFSGSRWRLPPGLEPDTCFTCTFRSATSLLTFSGSRQCTYGTMRRT